MIAMVCHFYKWSFHDVMKMPVITFFSFHAEAIKMEARQFRELLSISATPGMNFQYFEKLSHRYNRMINPKGEELPAKPSSFTLEAGSEEAKIVLMSTFGAMKRGLGYGR